VKGEKEELEPSVGTPSAAKTEAARGRSRTHRRRAHLPPLLPQLPRCRAAVAFVFLPADEPRHRTSPTPALLPRGHQGEDGHFPALVDAPAFEPRGNVPPHRAAAPPPLVMPAIVPGWVKSLAGAAAFINARMPFWLSLSFSPSCVAPCCSLL
jgi:hypothetical protein